MAEVILQNALSKIKQESCHVSSAGINALVGHKADEKVSQLMLARGLDVSLHRACQLNREMVRNADLVLVMESAHKLNIENREPSAKGKIFRLGEWGGYDIPDPYQLDIKVFESVLALIDLGVSQWVKKL
jgi:protein-tyrosine phosphatase